MGTIQDLISFNNHLIDATLNAHAQKNLTARLTPISTKISFSNLSPFNMQFSYQE